MTLPTAGINVSASLLTGRAPRHESTVARRQSDFASILSRGGARLDPRPGELPAQAARRAAESFVSITLVQPLLTQLRSTSQAAPPFAPTQAEKQIRSMLDAHLAQDIVRAARFPLVDRLARDLLKAANQGADNADTSAMIAGNPIVHAAHARPGHSQPEAATK